MPNEVEIHKVVGEAITAAALVGIGAYSGSPETIDSTVKPIVAAVGGWQTNVLLQQVLAYRNSSSPNKSLLDSTSSVLICVGVVAGFTSAAAAAPWLFAAGFGVKTVRSLKQAYDEPEKRKYHLADAAVSAAQAATISVGLGAKIKPATTMIFGGAASVAGGIKSLFFARKNTDPSGYVAMQRSSSAINPLADASDKSAMSSSLLDPKSPTSDAVVTIPPAQFVQR